MRPPDGPVRRPSSRSLPAIVAAGDPDALEFHRELLEDLLALLPRTHGPRSRFDLPIDTINSIARAAAERAVAVWRDRERRKTPAPAPIHPAAKESP